MDDRRFDALTRALGQGGSRRALLKGLLGLGGVATAGAVLRDADAARRGYSGPSTSTPGSQPTLPPQPTEPPPVPTGTTVPRCPGSQVPCGADCCCPAGNTKCGPDCCPIGQAECCDGACCYGTCYGEERCCPPGSRVCDGVCYPGGCCTVADCGLACQVCGADHVCRSCEEVGQDCQNGTCVPTITPSSTSVSTNTPTSTTVSSSTPTSTSISSSTPTGTSTPTSTPTSTSTPAPCGQNGAVCAPGEVCCHENCCAIGQTCCGGECCPSGNTCCGSACCHAEGDICCGGTCCAEEHCCQAAGECCAEGLTCCGDLCTNRQTDPANCGSCDNDCVPGQICTEGNCCTPQTVCQPGQCAVIADGCGGTLNCGPCPAGQACCDHVCADLQSDPANCAVCGRACPAGWVCCGGRCGILCDEVCCEPGATCVDETCDHSQCNATNCPGEFGFECINGGCFQVTSDLSCAGCSSSCRGKCAGDIDGSNSYLCAVDYYVGNEFVDCSSNAQCPSGTACYDSWICMMPC